MFGQKHSFFPLSSNMHDSLSAVNLGDLAFFWPTWTYEVGVCGGF